MPSSRWTTANALDIVRLIADLVDLNLGRLAFFDALLTDCSNLIDVGR